MPDASHGAFPEGGAKRDADRDADGVTDGVTDGAPTHIDPARRSRFLRTARAQPSVAALADAVRAGERTALARAITLVESTRTDDRHAAHALLRLLLPAAGNARRIGVTGIPGAGKSTFIEALGTLLTGRGHRIAVLTVDPSSERTGGSILGDKTRMSRLASDPNAFIRPSPTAGALGGVAHGTREAVLLCEAAGYDLVFVETVGVGQSETAVHALVDLFLLLTLPGAGDELQGLKRGIVEMADLIVVNKADGALAEAADTARRQLVRALRLYPPPPSGQAVQVLACSARTGAGLDAVWEAVTVYFEKAHHSGYLDARRREQAGAWLQQRLDEALRADFQMHAAVRAARAELEAAVLEGRLSASDAAARLLALYRG